MTTAAQENKTAQLEHDPLWTQWCRRPANLAHLSFEAYKTTMNPAGRLAVHSIGPQVVFSLAEPTRARHEAGKMNGLEKRYAQHLELRKKTGEIKDWKFEPLKLRLAPATYYSPDFLVEMPGGALELHETKGHWEDDARVKVKVAAAMFGCFRFVGARWDKNVKDWKFEEFQA